MINNKVKINDKYSKLCLWFKTNSRRSIIALSGGVDSGLVAMAAKEALQNNAIAITANYNTLSADELLSAKRVTKEIGIEHIIIEYDEMKNQRFIINNLDRCYHCRTELGSYLVIEAKKFNADTIVDGTNIDDLREYRPGIIALKEHGIRSPLVENGLSKEDIREIAEMKNLSVYDRPSNSCLASRIPTGNEITKEKLVRVERSENIVKKVLNLKNIRVRDHDNIARIEIASNEMEKAFDIEKISIINTLLREIGYKFVTLDLGGYRSGSVVGINA